MHPRITLITLGVDDLDRSLRFYRDGLGFPSKGIVGTDAVMRQAATAGAVVVKAAGSTFWGGYAGYSQDPDGHVWEVAYNPQWEG